MQCRVRASRYQNARDAPYLYNNSLQDIKQLGCLIASKTEKSKNSIVVVVDLVGSSIRRKIINFCLIISFNFLYYTLLHLPFHLFFHLIETATTTVIVMINTMTREGNR